MICQFTIRGICRAVALALSVAIVSGCSTKVNPELVGEPAPHAMFTRIEDGTRTIIEDYRGKTLVVAFWAASCRSATPNMKRLAEYAKRFEGRNDVAFVSVSLDKNEDLDKVRERIKYDGYSSMENMFSGNEGYDEAFVNLKGEKLPYIIVVDKFGKIIDLQTDDDFVYDLIKLGQPAPLASRKK